MYISKDFINGLILFTLISVGMYANAKVVIEESGANAFFMVDGHKTDAVTAAKAADSDTVEIKRCSPIKNSYTASGEPAFKCNIVIKRINPKNGNTSWKNQ